MNNFMCETELIYPFFAQHTVAEYGFAVNTQVWVLHDHGNLI